MARSNAKDTMMKLRKTTHQSHVPAGFTLLELVFAMGAFSLMLVIAVSGFLNAMWIYNQASASRNNQQLVRNIMDGLGRDIQAAQTAKYLPGFKALCMEGVSGESLTLSTGVSTNNVLYGVSTIGATTGHLVKRGVKGCGSFADLAVTGAEIDLMGGTVNLQTYDISGGGGNGFDVEVLQQNSDIDTTGLPKAKTVRVEFGIRRGTGGTTVREQQFNNSFGETATFLVQSSADDQQ